MSEVVMSVRGLVNRFGTQLVHENLDLDILKGEVLGIIGGSGAIGAIDVDPKSVEAHVTKLAGETFKGTATAAADIESLRSALPAEVAVSWGGLTFDAATGSTLLTAVKVTPKDNTEVGVSIDELRLYDLDVELLKARLRGYA